MEDYSLSSHTPLLPGGQIFQATRNYKPYTQFGSIQHWSNYGHNSHHGVTARVEKRYSAGVVVNAFYTLSKTIDDVDGETGAGSITFYNRGLEKGRSGYGVNHRFIGVFQYELPFGKGRKFVNGGERPSVHHRRLRQPQPLPAWTAQAQHPGVRCRTGQDP